MKKAWIAVSGLVVVGKTVEEVRDFLVTLQSPNYITTGGSFSPDLEGNIQGEATFELKEKDEK